jgi:hypothetical protein
MSRDHGLGISTPFSSNWIILSLDLSFNSTRISYEANTRLSQKIDACSIILPYFMPLFCGTPFVTWTIRPDGEATISDKKQ